MRSLRTTLLLSLLTASSAHADWPAGGRLVMSPVNSNISGSDLTQIVRLADDQLAIRASGRGGVSWGLSHQRLTADGALVGAWPAAGIGSSYGMGGYYPEVMGWTTVPTDSGAIWQARTFTSGSSTKMGAFHVTASGVSDVASAFTSTLNTGLQGTALVPALDGGVYGYTGSRLQRLTRAGTVAAGWPANAKAGIGLGNINANCPSAISDGEGGVIYFAHWGPSGFPTVLRVDSSGATHAGWLSTGLVLSNNAAEDGSIAFDGALSPPLIPSGPDGALACWCTPTPSSTPMIKVQRFRLDGTLDPAWPASGRQIAAPDTLSAVSMLPDGSGGAYITWVAHHTPYANHISASGALLTAAPGGLSLLGPTDHYEEPQVYLNPLRYVPAAVTPDGRLIFAWDDPATGEGIRVRWYHADLTIDSSEPAEGRLIMPEGDKGWVRAVASDAVSGAYVAWDRVITLPAPTFGFTDDIWMTRLAPTPIGAGVPPSAGHLALSAPRPNPARGSASFELTLPDDSAAQLELLDLAGRVVQARSVAGAGRHAITFDALDRVSPGLYFVRAVARTGVSTSRVVVSH